MLETATITETPEIKTENKEQPYYELYLLLHPSAIDANASETEKTLTDLIEKHGGKFKQLKKFVRCGLAYPIKKNNHAYAGSIYFWANAKNLEEIEAALKISELAILRSIILHIKPSSEKETLKNIDTMLEEKLSEPTKTHKIETRRPAEKERTQYAPTIEQREIRQTEDKKDETKITLDDIDKRLDEIMGNL